MLEQSEHQDSLVGAANTYRIGRAVEEEMVGRLLRAMETVLGSAGDGNRQRCRYDSQTVEMTTSENDLHRRSD